MFECATTLLDDLSAFATDPTVAAIPFSFASSKAGAGLLQLAAGRTPALLESREPDAAEFQAALRFLTYVVFDPRNNYFTLLCVDRNAPDEAIKDNYRRLIALVHPDANPIGFPADAASRVNLGYAVLSNAEARATYAGSLDRLPAITAFAAKEHQSDANAAHGAPRSQRPSPSRGLLAWIKRPRFGFGLLALAVILILPVVVILANMANDTGRERLISGRERSEPKQAALNIETITDSVSRVANSPIESNVAVRNKNSPALPRATAATRAEAPVQPSNAVVAVADAIRLPAVAIEQGAIGLSNVAPSPAPRNALAPSQPSMRLSLAPVRTRMFDQTEPSPTVSDSRTPRVAAPQSTSSAAAEAASSNTGGAPVVTQTMIKVQSIAAGSTQPAAQPRLVEARSRDSEDVLLRFGSAYEQGSIDNVRALFASAMPGRSQMIADYQRVFSNTRQRNIRFLQLRHTVAGQRVTTVGQAVVSTVGADYKNSSQRVFLEIEVARDGNELRIERISNYALD